MRPWCCRDGGVGGEAVALSSPPPRRPATYIHTSTHTHTHTHSPAARTPLARARGGSRPAIRRRRSPAPIPARCRHGRRRPPRGRLLVVFLLPPGPGGWGEGRAAPRGQREALGREQVGEEGAGQRGERRERREELRAGPVGVGGLGWEGRTLSVDDGDGGSIPGRQMRGNLPTHSTPLSIQPHPLSSKKQTTKENPPRLPAQRPQHGGAEGKGQERR